MNVVDSSAWLEYFTDGPHADYFAAPIEDFKTLIVPTVSLYEVFKKVLSERGEAEAFKAIAQMKQGRVVDLPSGATPVDFAYRVHTDLGHRCRGAKVDGQLLPLNTPLETGQQVEILTAKTGGPSRDWLNPTQGYIHTKSARAKVRAICDTSSTWVRRVR